MSKGFASSYRIVLIAVALVMCFGALGVRLVFLHVIEREQHLTKVAEVRRHMRIEKGRRGDILDYNGAKLATSVSVIVLGVDPKALVAKDEPKWAKLAELIEMPEGELRRIFNTKHKFVGSGPASAPPTAAGEISVSAAAIRLPNFDGAATDGAARVAETRKPADVSDADDDGTEADGVAKDGWVELQWAPLRDTIAESTYLAIEKLGIKGVYGRRAYRRVYPNGQLASHIVGYVNRQQVPAAGIENYAHLYLREVDGWSVGEKDGKGREVARFRNRDVPHADGYSVKLSIRSAVQDLVEQELAEIAKKFQPVKATIIVSDPRTGWIHGMGNYPTFDPNFYNKVPKEQQERMKNVAVADIYEPGSVFKIVAASGALEENLVSPHEVFDCALERFTYKGRSLDLPSEDHHMGDLTFAEIIAKSSNKGAAQLGMRLGEERFHKYATAFGFGRTLGFPVGGEVRGLFKPAKDWNALDITRIPMGHSISATALQMHQAMSAVANRGVLLHPQVIQEIRDANNEIIFKFDRQELNRAVSEETAKRVALLLMGVAMKGGTAPGAAITGYEVAGKTGTTQKLVRETRPDGSTKLVYSSKHHVASFVGFFPASNPQVVISVIVDDADEHTPGGYATGAKVAAPSFKNLGEKLIPILDIKAPGSAVAHSNLLAYNQGGRR